MSPDTRETAEEVFWKWFEHNESRLFNFEIDRESIFDEISAQLSAYQEGLVFEVSTENNGIREFIISADGIGELFQRVKALAAAAPKFERWSILAFRPRMENYDELTLDYAEKTFDPTQIWFEHSVEDGYFDLSLYYPDYDEDERDIITSGAYILLDMALGEYDVETGIRYIDHRQVPDNPEAEGLSPFTELRRIFDEHTRLTSM
jgi:hypothetical protein